MQRKDLLLTIIQEIGMFQRKHFGEDITFENKSCDVMDVVSFVDVESEKMFQHAVAEYFPDDQILGEESYDPNHDYQSASNLWIIDPLDGTYEFRTKKHEFSVSIAFVSDGEIQLAAIYYPMSDDLYFADETGTYKNQKPARVSNVDDFSVSMHNWPMSSVSRVAKRASEELIPFRSSFGQIRDIGPCTYKLTSVADGYFDSVVFLDDGLPWDLAAGAYIVQQSGGRICDIDGNPWHAFCNTLVASNSSLHEAIVQKISNHGS